MLSITFKIKFLYYKNIMILYTNFITIYFYTLFIKLIILLIYKNIINLIMILININNEKLLLLLLFIINKLYPYNSLYKVFRYF